MRNLPEALTRTHAQCVLPWCSFTAVITFKNSPLARGGYVFLEMSPLHRHVTVFVGAGDEFEKTRSQDTK